jgi:tetratricopeptide (TPR) repeat protein
VALLVICGLGAAARAEQSPEQRLASQFARDARAIVERSQLTIADIDMALLLAGEAVKLTPDDADLWRLRYELAVLGERVDTASEAIDRIVVLDPRDESARLKRISLAIDRYQTTEERIAAYRTALEEDSRAEIGNSVASRLALDLALLHRRGGEEEAFSAWLTEAVNLDPANRAAAALAAGYFQSRLDDRHAQAELLVNLLLADPADLMTQASLGRLLLEGGAYQGAERMLRLAVHPRPMAGIRSGSDTFADLAISQWASGSAEEALDTIRWQQRQADERFRALAERRDEKLSPLDLARLRAPLDATLETTRAAILNRIGDENAAGALASVASAYEDLWIKSEQDPEARQKQGLDSTPDPVKLAQLHLEAAWVLAWLGGEPDRIQQHVDEAHGFVPLSDEARQRFAGWIALRRGNLDEAVARLTPLSQDDMAARLGLALVRLDLGKRREAAFDLLAVARDRPGALVNVWAADLLYELLGQRVPISEEAQQLEQLVRTIPVRIDRALDDPTLIVGLRVMADQTSFAGYEPVIVNIEITNNWHFPLAIDRDGPIRSVVALDVSLRLTHSGDQGMFLRPIVVDIGRRLTLEPHERLVIPVDLRRYAVGQLLDKSSAGPSGLRFAATVEGAILRVGGLVNFISPTNRLGQPLLKPGTLGSEANSIPFRVEGVRIERRWIEGTLADILAERPQHIELMAELSQIVGLGGVANLGVEERALFADAMSGLTEAYTRLDPVGQAWLLSVLEESSADPILAVARKSDDYLVKMSYLLYCLEGAEDPMLDAARRDEDPRVRVLAEWRGDLYRRIEAAAEKAAERAAETGR